MDISRKVREIVEPIIKENNYILDEVEYVKEGSVYFLRIIIDKDGFIDFDDCVKVSELINPIVDEMDFLTDSYVLDVCSKEKGSE